ncbi:MAG: ABC transporter substrate-binding protein, partial [Olsenella sp.]|nr:ABC transporter substrate-binding protein [Olsenella sp.]
LALAGCGAYDNSKGASQQGGSGAAAGSSRKITFCLDYTPNTNHTGIYVARDKGYFAEEGLEVEIVQPAEDTAETMIGTGQAQLGVSYQDYIANALAADANMPIKAVAAIIQHNTSGIMSRKADGITSARGMQDHTYATWDLPVEQATIRQVVEADGGDFSKVRMVPYTVDDEVAGLRSNLFDTVWVYEGWAVQNAAVQGFDVNYFSFVSMDDVFDYYTPVIAANGDFAKANPDVVRAFLRAAKRGYQFAIDDPDAAADLLCSAVPELDRALARQSQHFLAGQYTADAPSWGVIDGKRWSAFYQWLNDNKLVASPLDVNAGWTMDYLER